MTIDYDSLPAGSELDALVANLMGIDPDREHDEVGETSSGNPYCIACHRTGNWGADIFGETKCVPLYSEDIAAAFQVVEKLQGGLRFELRRRPDNGYWAHFGEEMTAEGETAPLAICRAALKTKTKGKLGAVYGR